MDLNRPQALILEFELCRIKECINKKLNEISEKICYLFIDREEGRFQLLKA